MIWVLLENRAYVDVAGSRQMPYLNQLGEDCYLATAYRGVSHPSLPNYIALTSGTTAGLATDCAPTNCPVDAPSVFGQLSEAKRDWRVWAQGANNACDGSDHGRYAVKHIPALYYADAAADCGSSLVPLGTASAGTLHDDLAGGHLPALGVIVPDLCDDGHDCSNTVVDAFLRTWVPQVLASPGYRDGSTLLVITYDEGEGAGRRKGEDCLAGPLRSSCQVFFTAIAPWLKAGTVDASPYSHYSLLRTTQDLLGLPALGAAAATSPMNFDP